jgi:hypothetical protein
VTLALRFDPKLVRPLASRFPAGDDDAQAEIGARSRARTYLEKEDFLALCEWKTPRTRPRCASNDAGFVRAVTGTALTSPDERLRIEVLTLLDGVNWPTASVILHFCHQDPYPILDWRALWSVGVEGPARYDFALWREYTLLCRSLARRCRVSMRTLDRALWQYSVEAQ